MIDRLRISLNRIMNPCLGLEEFFKLTADLGLGKVELRNDLAETGIIDSYSPDQVKDLVHRYAIKILTVNALQRFNLGSVRQELIEELKGLINLSVSIGCEAVVLCPNNDPNDPRDTARMYSETVEALKALALLFEESGLMGYVEPLGFRQSSLRSLPTAVRAIQESGSNCYKIVHDTFHHPIGPDELDTLKYAKLWLKNLVKITKL
ncbi:MAG: TIM barrel protein [Planctomycetes bacterium]|nr:TIM barrel protein [Planctomycetota bacterium]